jgi:hypothetical protein
MVLPSRQFCKEKDFRISKNSEVSISRSTVNCTSSNYAVSKYLSTS